MRGSKFLKGRVAAFLRLHEDDFRISLFYQYATVIVATYRKRGRHRRWIWGSSDEVPGEDSEAKGEGFPRVEEVREVDPGKGKLSWWLSK
ncbi:hypothetical protein KFK09_002574 [Dendrobium nobile]|uniref:Uncharacterized protein n=1 Tax=Dendrobium nobile TaxID=94219 RepID=A0A8T3C420_DENNO|nr:hypothetical protein KFK09_002574 [Dendrobium nobile]